MSLIFVGSADSKSDTHSFRLIEPLLHWLFPHMSQDHVEAIHHVIRKCGHLTEYGILGLLVSCSGAPSASLFVATGAPGAGARPSPPSWSSFSTPPTDEFHQIFVPTRTPLVSDVFIDTSDAIIGMIVLWSLGKWNRWWPNKSQTARKADFRGRVPEQDDGSVEIRKKVSTG
jgi:hypothetical protein